MLPPSKSKLGNGYIWGMKRKDIKQDPYETYRLKDGRIVRTYWVRQEGDLRETAYHYVNDVQIGMSYKDELIKNAIDSKIGG